MILFRALPFIQMLFILTTQLLASHGSVVQSANLSLNPTIQTLDDVDSNANTLPNDSLQPTPVKIELNNPPPTLLYPDKLPKFIEQKGGQNNTKKKKRRKRREKSKERKKVMVEIKWKRKIIRPRIIKWN